MLASCGKFSIFMNIFNIQLISLAFQKEKKIQQKKKLVSIWKFNYKYRKTLDTTQRK